jgi:hypothetical protein
MRLAKYSSTPPSVEEVEAAVATILRRESRSPERVLAAALTTWYATRIGAATLAQMGRRFDREPTTLRADIESHRKSNASLFDMALEEFEALIGIHVPTTTALKVAGQQEAPSSVETIALSVSRVSDEASPGHVLEARPHSVPARKSVAILRLGQPSPGARSADLPSACAISNEDFSCRGMLSDSEPNFGMRRRNRAQE